MNRHDTQTGSAVAFDVDGGIAVITIDNPPVNVLSHAVRAGLFDGIARAQADAAVHAVVILCAGTTFIAGADITEFGAPLKDPRVRQIAAAIEAADKPVIAALHGTALGGGLEVSLACHWRIALASCKFGLPEVNIGLIPGAGGTQRLTRLVGPESAMEITTSGKHFSAQYGLSIGLIDEIITDELRQGAIAFARKVLAERRPMRVTSRLQDRIRDASPAIFSAFRQKLQRSARGQVAPLKCVEGVEIACREPFEVGDRWEATTIDALLHGPDHAAMKHLFKAERDARKIPNVDSLQGRPIGRAGVIGAGTMGGGIAMSLANAGVRVVLVDINEDALDRGMSAVRRNYAISVERRSMTQHQMDAALALITTATDYDPLLDADIIIEAAVEDMRVKKQIFARLDARARPSTILATNTSSLDIDEIASATGRPDKVIGTHFFSPANVMKLLENVRGARTSPETIATVMNMGKAIGKVAVLARNCNGFIGNRMFQFYNNAWEYLLEEGATPEQIDRVAMTFGMAMGPVAVRDLAGLDVAALVRAARAPTLPPQERISPLVERLVATGRCGQKTGAGFYRYDGRKPVSDPAATQLIEDVARELGIQRRNVQDEEIMPRLLAPLVNEGAKIVEEGIALRAGDIDVTYCYGYGFPKHLGGPMFWAERYGLKRILATVEMLADRFGPRYRPAPLLQRLVRDGQGWASSAASQRPG